MAPDINARFVAVINDIMRRYQISELGIEREVKLNKILRNIRAHENIPSTNTIFAIIARYNEYSSEWIVTGRGSMYFQSVESAAEMKRKYDTLLRLNIQLQEKLRDEHH